MPDIVITSADIAEARGGFLALPFEVDVRLLEQCMRARPDLAGVAAEWGWDDTEVREALEDDICRALIARPWPTGGETVDMDALERAITAAHDRWVQRADAAEAADHGAGPGAGPGATGGGLATNIPAKVRLSASQPGGSGKTSMVTGAPPAPDGVVPVDLDRGARPLDPGVAHGPYVAAVAAACTAAGVTVTDWAANDSARDLGSPRGRYRDADDEDDGFETDLAEVGDSGEGA